jgi:CRP-like cAMP-binding protein
MHDFVPDVGDHLQADGDGEGHTGWQEEIAALVDFFPRGSFVESCMRLPDSAAGESEVLSARELMADALFAGIPPKFLLWQQGLVLRRRLRAGDVLCYKGDAGNTAYLIKSGRLLISAPGNPPLMVERGPEHTVVGEMACISGKPRAANVSALVDSEIWEVRRNVLERLMRTPSQQEKFEAIFRQTALDVVLRESVLFKGLDPTLFQQCIDFLRPRLSFVRVRPGQTIFKQNADADNLYLIRLGHIKVSIQNADRSTKVFYAAPGGAIGEIGLLALSRDDAKRPIDEIDKQMELAFQDTENPITSLWPASPRTATCSALDHVEMARISRKDFLEMIKAFPVLRRRLIETALKRMGGENDDRPAVRQYVEQGLFQGQSLLVLDLTKCTRCDECTRACMDQHGTKSHGAPITRLLRQGLHFGDYLVATSCRSCKDAYCMIGCPVDAIHRGKHQQIIIEDHCIGCGLCAKNCPYGNIWMIENVKDKKERPSADEPGEMEWVAQPKAATCDLCDKDGNLEKAMPRCVYACPHDAAHRMTGEALLAEVTGKKE